MLTTTIKRLTAATFAGGLMAVIPLAMPAADAVPVAAAPSCATYQGTITTTTTLALSPSSVSKGDTFTATATVESSVGPAPTGTVTFTYGGKTKTATLTPGATSSTASVTFVAKSAGAVRASYNGQCVGGVEAVGSSSSGPVILGLEASRGHSGANIAGVSGNGGVLAATGLDNQTELYGLLGVGMVAVGGLTLMVHRRRVQA